MTSAYLDTKGDRAGLCLPLILKAQGAEGHTCTLLETYCGLATSLEDED